MVGEGPAEGGGPGAVRPGAEDGAGPGDAERPLAGDPGGGAEAVTGDALAEGAAMPVQRGVEGLSSILTRVGALVYQAAAVRARGAVVELQGEEGSLDPDAVSEERALLWEATIAEQVGLPRRLWRASFRAGQPGQALGRAWTFLLEGEYHAGRCLVLAGPTGGGKTYAAAAALRHVGRTTLSFFYFPGVVNALLDQNERKEMLASLKHSRFIVLDDVGTEYRKQGGLVEALFDEVI